jgi:signal transduction histidine kinase
VNDVRIRRRTFVAIALALAAVVVPGSAWLIVGQNAARQQATEIREEPRRRGETAARALADRLLGRLESIRDAESQRPAAQFQAHPLGELAECTCAVHDVSPLVTGPQDPFTEAYFEIDPSGVLSLPILEPLSGVDPDPDRYQRAWELAPSLRSAVRDIRISLEAEAAPNDLTLPAFQWHGIDLDGEPRLVALRGVTSERGNSIQGFALSASAVRGWLAAAELPARFGPWSDVDDPRVAVGEVPLDCTRWEVAVGFEPAAVEAEARAAAILSDFWRSFSIGSGAALLAIISLVVLILSTERQARERARFAASAAHELRTPLTGLRLYGEMLRDGIDEPERVARYAERISEESERLSRVVTNVLEFTRLERGTLQVNLSDVDPVVVLSDLVERMKPALASNGATIKFDPADFEGTVRADAEALGQIVQNLVDNAEKYSRDATDRTVHLALDRTNGSVTMEVRDHGPGIAPELGRRLFEPFARGTSPDQPAGLGLGLALARELAKAQGAKLDHRTPAQGGAAFVLTYHSM